MFANFRKAYYNKDDTYFSLVDFKTKCPLIVFDCTHMDSAIKSSTVDVRLELTFSKKLPKNTNIYVLILYDYSVSYLPLSGLVLRE